MCTTLVVVVIALPIPQNPLHPHAQPNPTHTQQETTSKKRRARIRTKVSPHDPPPTSIVSPPHPVRVHFLSKVGAKDVLTTELLAPEFVDVRFGL